MKIASAQRMPEAGHSCMAEREVMEGFVISLDRGGGGPHTLPNISLSILFREVECKNIET